MTDILTLEQATHTLSLREREELFAVIDRSIAEEYQRLAAASVAAAIRKIERRLSKFPLDHDEVSILDLKLDNTGSHEKHRMLRIRPLPE